MDSSATKILMSWLIVFILAGFGAHIYNSVKENVPTEETVTYTFSDNIVFDGVFVRNEQVVSYNGSGAVDYIYPDGSKLSNSSVIAEIYDSESQIYAKKKAEELEDEIQLLERSQKPGTTNYAKPEAIKLQVDELYLTMTAQIECGDFDEVRKTENEITMLMNIYNVVTQTETDYNARIKELKTQAESYRAACGEPLESVSTDHTGYFVSRTDGYETVLNTSDIDSLDVQKIKDVVAGKGANKQENAIGKILDTYSCKIVGVVKPSTRILKGSNLKARFGSLNKIYDVTVSDVKKIDDENSIVILDCEDMDEMISSKRVEKTELIFQEFTGLKVPRDAIRFRNIKEEVTNENGLKTTEDVKYKGVYVRVGQDVEFKKIDVIYEGDEFVLSDDKSDDESNGDFLSLYDQIIMEEVKESDVSD